MDAPSTCLERETIAISPAVLGSSLIDGDVEGLPAQSELCSDELAELERYITRLDFLIKGAKA
jgi:hypothetical protein